MALKNTKGISARELTRFTKREVDQLFRTAKAVHKSDGLTILCAPKQKAFGRALLITSRKVGNAPKRNKLRRQLRSIFYQNKLYDCGVDCAFITRAPLTKKSFSELQTMCINALAKP